VDADAATPLGDAANDQADTVEPDPQVDGATSNGVEAQSTAIDENVAAPAEMPETEAPTASEGVTVSESSQPSQEAEPNTSTSM
jgi:hypothetical protein